MKMADAVLPLEEDNGKDDAANQKSLREQLSDSWGGQGYYAKLASQMQTPPAKSILKASRFGAAANNEGACRSAAKNTAVNVAANGPARGMADEEKSVTERRQRPALPRWSRSLTSQRSASHSAARQQRRSRKRPTSRL